MGRRRGREGPAIPARAVGIALAAERASRGIGNAVMLQVYID